MTIDRNFGYADRTEALAALMDDWDASEAEVLAEFAAFDAKHGFTN